MTLIGPLKAQYTLTGYDASAHMSEETHEAATSAPRGDHLRDLRPHPPRVDERRHRPPRDDLPGGRRLPHEVNRYQHALDSAATLANAGPPVQIWIDAVGAFILSLPYLCSAVAYAAVTSIAVIGFYVAYVAPVFLRLRAGKRFEPGPWTLGRWSKPVGILVTRWVVFIFILFMLPQLQPIDIHTFDCTPVVFAVVLGRAALRYLASTRKWFKGPKVHGTPDELAAIEADLGIIRQSPGPATRRPGGFGRRACVICGRAGAAGRPGQRVVDGEPLTERRASA